MPWCPNCKTEYRFGVNKCSDCGSDLSDEIPSEAEERIPLVEFESEKKDLAEKFLLFLEAEAIEGAISEITDSESVKISVPKHSHRRALKIFSAFSKIEEERELASLSEEKRRELLLSEKKKAEKAKDVHVYTRAKDRYQDSVSSAVTFIIMGVIGLFFTFLNQKKVFRFMSGEIQMTVSYLLFFACILGGMLMLHKRGALKSNIEAEEEMWKKYMDWLSSQGIERFEKVSNPEASSEENEILILDEISKALIKEFPDIDENFADAIADDFYASVFTQK